MLICIWGETTVSLSGFGLINDKLCEELLLIWGLEVSSKGSHAFALLEGLGPFNEVLEHFYYLQINQLLQL